MKPLLYKDITNFLKRFDNFVDGEVRSIDITSPSQMRVVLAGQDEARDFDWLTIEFEFDGVSDAKFLENSKLSYIDMSNGISLIYEDSNFYFAIDRYDNSSSVKNSICFLQAKNIKYKEASF